MQETMNLKIKFRESFRPFAPSVLQAKAAEWFDDCEHGSPYMLTTAPVAADKRHDDVAGKVVRGLDQLQVQRSQIPAVTHVDFSARLQTVGEGGSPRYARLLEAFNELTGCPVLINTSFNVRGEPIVAAPVDAYRCFMATDMDYLVMGNYVLAKADQPDNALFRGHVEKFELD